MNRAARGPLRPGEPRRVSERTNVPGRDCLTNYVAGLASSAPGRHWGKRTSRNIGSLVFRWLLAVGTGLAKLMVYCVASYPSACPGLAFRGGRDHHQLRHRVLSAPCIEHLLMVRTSSTVTSRSARPSPDDGSAADGTLSPLVHADPSELPNQVPWDKILQRQISPVETIGIDDVVRACPA